MDLFELIQDVLCVTLMGTELVDMAADLNQLLFSFANYSNYYAVLTVLLCFLTTAVLIIRFNNDLLNFPMLSTPALNFATEKPMTGYSNPFSVQLKSSSQKTLKDGLTVSMSSLTGGQLFVFWGPKIQPLHEILQWSADRLMEDLASGQLLGEDKSLAAEPVVRLEKDQNCDLHFPCPATVDETSLGPSPRERYPCVVIAVLPGGPNNLDQEISSVVANFTIIHLKDSLVTQESYTISQYLKLQDGRVFNLQPLFLASTEETPANQSLSRNTQRTSTSSNSSQDGNEESLKTSVAKPDECTTCVTTSNNLQEASARLCSFSEDSNSGLACAAESSEISKQFSTEVCDGDAEKMKSCTKFDKGRETFSFENRATKQEVRLQNLYELREEIININDTNRNIDKRSCDSKDGNDVSCMEVQDENASSLTRNSFQSESDHTDLQTDSCLKGPECIVCQTNLISHVVLPCRHASVCSLCFVKLDRCPMCRGCIDSYFTLFDDGLREGDSSEQTASHQGGFVAWFENLNNRVNEYLGFT